MSPQAEALGQAQGSAQCRAPVEIRRVKVGELEAFARTALGSLAPGEVVPVSPSRARAQTRNPDASPDDVGLLLAYQDGRCVGTLGLVPGRLRVGDRVETVDWLSAWYVPPECRNTGAGVRLLTAALATGRMLAASDSSDESLKLYDAMRFKDVGPLRYVAADLSRWNVLGLPLKAIAKLVRKRRPAWAGALDRAARAVAGPSLAVISAWLATATAADGRRYAARRVERIEVGPEEFRAALDRRAPVRFDRGPAVINWMLADRWVVGDPSQATPGYYFRDCDRHFDFAALEVTERATGRRAGYVVLRTDSLHGRRTVTVLDRYLPDPADERCVLPLALARAREFGADRVLLPLDSLATVQTSSRLRRFFRVAERPYRLRLARPDAELSRALDRMTLDLADGDVGFA
jgi:hypothetical protein